MASLLLRKSGGEDLDVFYPIRPECQADVPKIRFRARAGKTLSARRWHAAFSEDGRLDMAKVLRRIQRGGIHPSIKGLVWEFLLGCYDPNSTFEEQNQLKQRRRQQYNAWKTECQNMVPVIGSGKFITTAFLTDDGQPLQDSSTNSDLQDQECHVNSSISDKKVLQWMLCLHQIGLDVVRTDRALVFYENKANQSKLWDVLAIYSWVDSDIGYVQGMNDICSPMVILLENEADAFWCYEHAMRRLLMWAMEYNPNIFLLYKDSSSNKSDPPKVNDKMLKHYGKFERKNVKSGQTDNQSALAVFLVASVLENRNKKFLKEAKGLDDVVKILGDIIRNLDAKKACDEALKLHKKYLSKVGSILLSLTLLNNYTLS
ncbi:hypothetical protein LWI28_011573 [Acer negundo]|uniref:Rab-GAP TBC domain-containing protein n=1 Tax=Acer negundo TaxID=4023 RepID=A0AAD5IYV9_ACENE|nr:hypothetical protein LWI28_011573 [Acer negundo]